MPADSARPWPEMDGIVSAGGTTQPTPGAFDPARVATNFVVFKVDRDRAAFLPPFERETC